MGKLFNLTPLTQKENKTMNSIASYIYFSFYYFYYYFFTARSSGKFLSTWQYRKRL